MSVDGIDNSPEGIGAIRDKLIELRDSSMDQWPEAIPFTVVMSHAIVLLAELREIKEKSDHS